MSDHLMRIDILSSSEPDDDEELTEIRLEGENIIELNFPKFFILSKYLQEKYKYSEALSSIQSEIENAKATYQIKADTIKHFFEFIQAEEVNISFEQYKDFYKLSEYFNITKFTKKLSKIGQVMISSNIEFSILTLLDINSSTNQIDANLQRIIETFLSNQINECIKNEKFGELPISIIYRILLKSNKENISTDSLLDFILGSVETRLSLFKFVEVRRLTKSKIEEMIEFLENQTEKIRSVCLEFLPFDLLYVKQMTDKYDSLLDQFKQIKQNSDQTKQNLDQIKQDLDQIKQELDQTKQDLDQTKQNLDQTKQDLDQTKQDLDQTKQDLDQTKQDLDQTKQGLDQTKIKLEQALDQQSELKKAKDDSTRTKQYAQSIIVAGYNGYRHLYENSSLDIDQPKSLPIDPSSLLSYSVYNLHAVIVTKNGQLLGAGYNDDGRISSKLPKETIRHFTVFSINDRDGCNLVPVSAVCSSDCTLYMFAKSSSKCAQLVLCDRRINGGDPIFLDIGGKEPLALFGGCHYTAAISSEGEVILINSDSIRNYPSSSIASFSLPDGEKATSVAFCRQLLFVLSSRGRVFSSPIQSQSCVLNFSSVSEIANHEIVCVSGTIDFCLAVSREGLAFAFGSNECGQLGLGKETRNVSTFTKISSLLGHEIRAAYAGCYHSFFETREGKILACGQAHRGQLFLNGGKRNEDVYSPTETIITGAKFSVLGNRLSAVFIGGDPPPNTPNMRVFI